MRLSDYTQETSDVAYDFARVMEGLINQAQERRRLRRMGASTECLDAFQKQFASEMIELADQQARLIEADMAGLEYERLTGSLAVNKKLPALPKGALRVRLATLHHERSSTKIQLAGIMAAVLVVVGVMAVTNILPLWTMSPLRALTVSATGSSSTVANTFAALAAFVLMGHALFSRKFATANVLERQHRFFLGAGGWDLRQRLTACGLYAVSSWWVLLCPVVIVPVRFCLAGANTWLHVRHYDAKRSESVTQAVLTSAQFTRVFVRSLTVFATAAFALSVMHS